MEGQIDLFDFNKKKQTPINKPLAQRMRPDNLNDFIGQDNLLSKNSVLKKLIENDNISSMIFWGPPGVGKTTLARIIANKTSADFIELSAVNSGVKDIKEIMNKARIKADLGVKTIVFIDEIHRFNKAQQDAFLPYVEDGSIILIGATTENPSFEINKALLSRCKVFVFERLAYNAIITLLKKAITDIRSYPNKKIIISDKVLNEIAKYANGDARVALNMLELSVKYSNSEGINVEISDDIIDILLERGELFYDKDGEEHYNIISALHKCMRNSDPDGAVYWVSRMLEGGEEPLYIARRIIQFASEDIGLADSNALTMAINAYQACHFLGMPDCDLALIHAAIYMSLAPKSDAVYRARLKSKSDVYTYGALEVPMHLRNAPTKLMAEAGYAKGYKHPHLYEDKITDMTGLPTELLGKEYYYPSNLGKEKKLKIRLDEIKKLRYKNN